MASERERPSQDDLIAALETAHAALIGAAAVVALRYGPDMEHAAQLAGAARMIHDDWIPTIRAEPQP